MNAKCLRVFFSSSCVCRWPLGPSAVPQRARPELTGRIVLVSGGQHNELGAVCAVQWSRHAVPHSFLVTRTRQIRFLRDGLLHSGGVDWGHAAARHVPAAYVFRRWDLEPLDPFTHAGGGCIS